MERVQEPEKPKKRKKTGKKKGHTDSPRTQCETPELTEESLHFRHSVIQNEPDEPTDWRISGISDIPRSRYRGMKPAELAVCVLKNHK